MKVVDLAKRLDVKVENVLEIMRAGGIEVKGGDDELQIAALSKIVREISRSVPALHSERKERRVNPTLRDLALNLNDELDRITAEARYHDVRLSGQLNSSKQNQDNRGGSSTGTCLCQLGQVDKNTVGNPAKHSLSCLVKEQGLARKVSSRFRDRYVITGIVLFLSIALFFSVYLHRWR
jgi:hypothetical protein